MIPLYLLPMIVQYKHIPLLDNYSQRKKDDVASSRTIDEIQQESSKKNESPHKKSLNELTREQKAYVQVVDKQMVIPNLDF